MTDNLPDDSHSALSIELTEEANRNRETSEISGLTGGSADELTLLTSVTSTSTCSAESENVFEDETLQKIEETAVKRNALDDLTYEELVKTVKELKAESKHLTTENDMLERYLTLNDPQLIEGMTQTIENAIKMQGSELVRRATLADTYSTKSYTSANKAESSIVGTSSIIDRGPRINLTQKSDMIMKEMDELQKSLNKFYKNAHKRKCILKAELEEVSLELEDTAETIRQFEQTVVTEGVDPLTQRIPAEKFIRYNGDIDDLKERIRQEIRLISPEVIENVQRETLYRIQKCLEVNGQHIGHQ